MSQPNPYEQLGVSENASFDDIQEARSRLVETCGDDRKRLEAVEMAYDAVLMDRLRLRQEGRIKVPSEIAYPEKASPAAPPTPAVKSDRQVPNWLRNSFDRPEQSELIWPSSIYLGLGALALFYPQSAALLQLVLAGGVGSCLYFLNRKEQRFGRSVGITLLALIVGLLLGSAVASLPAIAGGMNESLTAAITLFILWLASCFLR